MRLFAVIVLLCYCSFSLAFAPARHIDAAPWARTVASDDKKDDLSTSPTSSSSSSMPEAESQTPSTPHSSTKSTDSHIIIKTSSTRMYIVTESSSNNDPFDFATIAESSINRDPFNFSTITEAHSSSASSTSADTTSIEIFESSLSAQPTSASRNATDQPQTTPPPAPTPTTSFQPPANQTGSATTSSTSPVTKTSLAPPPAHCAPGTSCSVVLGVGLSLGSVAFIVVFLVVSGRYRKFLAASQQSYRDHRRRRHSADEPYGPSNEPKDLNMTSFNQTQTTSPPPEYRHKDELFLPEDVQQVVRSVDSMQQQKLRMPADAYGNISRKTLPKSTNF